MSALELIDVSKAYAGVTAVDRVSLLVDEGEFVSLVGGSGCGKTTLLRLIAGFTAPDSGTVKVHGRPVADLPPHQRAIGFVFQSYALFPTMTVAQNIGFALRLARQHKTDIAARVDELCRLAQLDGLQRRYPHELSGGQQQRVALVRALAPKPRVLLLDEPLSALDAQIRAALRIEIRRIIKELGITALYVTHDQEEALSISDRVAVMRSGRLLQIGRPMDVYLRPATVDVATFVGTSNRFAGHVAGGAMVAQSGQLIGPVDGQSRADTVVTACVRPEHVSVCHQNQAGANWATGRIANVLFHGQTVRVVIQAGLEAPVLADLPTAAWQALVLAVGDRIAWQAQRGHVTVFDQPALARAAE
jgi:putative spermidine/putrescine transport system ATP-binding protein